jgi:thioesterase domain-containing protein
MARDAIDEMRRFQPEGPYLLAGECVGGVVAYEMARQLRAAGQELDLLLLLDTDRPSAAPAPSRPSPCGPTIAPSSPSIR